MPNSLWLTNSGTVVSYIEFDANDGSGYRTLTPGTAVPIAYADTGLVNWNFKLHLTDYTVLQSHTQIHITQDPLVTNSGGFNEDTPTTSNGVTSTYANNIYTVASTATYNGVQGHGLITISYGSGHSSLTKPLIIAEGFDPGIFISPESQFGLNDIYDFKGYISKSLTLSSLILGNYDIVYIDFTNGTDDIKRNALVVEDVIRWVNAHKTGGNQNVVLGSSMGGLCARYALKKMEDASENHDTRLFISDDSPQQGANVPLGYQFMERHLSSFYIKLGILPTLADFIEVFDRSLPVVDSILTLSETPAARQMLINYVDRNNLLDNSVHNAWQTELTNLGYPAQCRNIAISNGAECGTIQAYSPPGGQLLNAAFNYRPTDWGNLLDIVTFPVIGLLTLQTPLLLGVVPGRNSITANLAVNAAVSGGGNQVYSGSLVYHKKLFYLINVNLTLTSLSHNAYSGILPYESYAGGYYDASNVKLMVQNLNLNISNGFGFVPVTSALDISGNSSNLSASDYTIGYHEDSPPSSPKNSPFASFVTAFSGGSNNEPHISFEDHNGKWLAHELSSSSPAVGGCAFFCDNQVISGSDGVCNTPSTFSVGSNSSITYTWNTSTNIQIQSGQGTNSVSLQSASGGYGAGTISITMHSADCGDVTVTKQVSVGGPLDYYAVQKFDNSQQFCTNAFGNTMTVEPQNISDITYFEWGYTDNVNPPVVVNSYGGYYQDFVFPAGGTYEIYARAGNDCGLGITRTCTVYVDDNCGGDGGGGFMAYPNPAGDRMTITTARGATAGSSTNAATANSTSTAVTANARKAFTYKLYNKQGKIVKQGATNNTTDAAVDTHDLAAETYYLHVFVGKTEYQRQIIIKH